MKTIGAINYYSRDNWEIDFYDDHNVETLKNVAFQTTRKILESHAYTGQTNFSVYGGLEKDPQNLKDIHELAGWVDGLLVIKRNYSVVITIPLQTITLANN